MNRDFEVMDLIGYNGHRLLVIKTFYKSSGEQTFVDAIDNYGKISHIDVDKIEVNFGRLNLDKIL